MASNSKYLHSYNQSLNRNYFQMIYVPALAFNQLSSVNIHTITPIVMAICVFYTCLGGIKAVVYTDVIQIIIMFGTLVTIAIKGTLKIGGVSTVIQRNFESGRIELPK